jgi:MarR family transcriptional regulator, organic hydroperoxide resistance regulator
MSVAATSPSTDREGFVRSLDDFLRAVQRARGRASQAQEEGLSVSQYHVMAPLAEGPQGVKALALAAGVAPPTATRMLDGLARDGFVHRAPNEHDRRCVSVSLTPEGERALERKRREIAAARARIADSLDPAERAQAAVLLGRLAQVIEEQF